MNKMDLIVKLTWFTTLQGDLRFILINLSIYIYICHFVNALARKWGQGISKNKASTKY